MSCTKNLLLTALSFAMIGSAGASDLKGSEESTVNLTSKGQNPLPDLSSPILETEEDQNFLKEKMLLVVPELYDRKDSIVNAQEIINRGLKRYYELNARMDVIIQSNRELLAEASKYGSFRKPAGK